MTISSRCQELLGVGRIWCRFRVIDAPNFRNQHRSAGSAAPGWPQGARRDLSGRSGGSGGGDVRRSRRDLERAARRQVRPGAIEAGACDRACAAVERRPRGRPCPLIRNSFDSQGIEPLRMKIVVVKSPIGFRDRCIPLIPTWTCPSSRRGVEEGL